MLTVFSKATLDIIRHDTHRVLLLSTCHFTWMCYVFCARYCYIGLQERRATVLRRCFA